MALLLSESDVRAVLTMRVALDAVETAFRHLAAGAAVLHPRRRIEVPGNTFLHYMAAADTVTGYMGLKMYTSVRGRIRFLVPLYRTATGELAALVEADYLGQMRTGAASGVATKYMARTNARLVGIIGTGGQARTQLEAICAVRSIERIRCFGRNAQKRAAFALEMSGKLGVPVEAAASAAEAVRGAEIVVTATTSSRPVLMGEWLSPGVHINAVGGNFPQKRELDDVAVCAAARIAADSVEQSRMEAGDLIQVLDEAGWGRVVELAEIVAGGAPGRGGEEEMTLFKSNGIALWDVATAAAVLELAQERGLGTRLDLWERSG